MLELVMLETTKESLRRFDLTTGQDQRHTLVRGSNRRLDPSIVRRLPFDALTRSTRRSKCLSHCVNPGEFKTRSGGGSMGGLV